MAAKLVTVLLILEVGFISNIIAGHPSGKSRRQDNEQDSDDHEDSMQTGCTLNKLLNCKTQLNITCEDLGGSNSSKHGAEIWESLLSNKTDSNVSMIDTELMYIDYSMDKKVECIIKGRSTCELPRRCCNTLTYSFDRTLQLPCIFTTSCQCSESPSNTATMMNTPVTTPPSCTQATTILVQQTTVTVITTASTTLNNSLSKSTRTSNTSVTLLGILFGLSLALLVVVIIGWVCTCWWKAKRGTLDRHKLRKANTTNTHGEPERLFDNPTYDGTSTTQQTGTQQPFTYAVYDAVTQPSRRTTQKGRMYNVLQRGKESGSTTRHAAVRGVVTSHSDMSYSLLHDVHVGLKPKDIKNNYHLIEENGHA